MGNKNNSILNMSFIWWAIEIDSDRHLGNSDKVYFETSNYSIWLSLSLFS